MSAHSKSMRVFFVRHGSTPSNDAMRYLGRADEPLSPRGVSQALALRDSGLVPDVDMVFTSPLARCVQTAGIAFPSHSSVIIHKFIEIDFGIFEHRTHDEMMESEPAYARWIESGGTGEVPGGETMGELKARCLDGFREMIAKASELKCNSVAAVVHSGVIMSLMSLLRDPPVGFYDAYVPNCAVAACVWDGERLRNVELLNAELHNTCNTEARNAETRNAELHNTEVRK